MTTYEHCNPAVVAATPKRSQQPLFTNLHFEEHKQQCPKVEQIQTQPLAAISPQHHTNPNQISQPQAPRISSRAQLLHHCHKQDTNHELNLGPKLLFSLSYGFFLDDTHNGKHCFSMDSPIHRLAVFTYAQDKGQDFPDKKSLSSGRG